MDEFNTAIANNDIATLQTFRGLQYLRTHVNTIEMADYLCTYVPVYEVLAWSGNLTVTKHIVETYQLLPANGVVDYLARDKSYDSSEYLLQKNWMCTNYEPILESNQIHLIRLLTHHDIKIIKKMDNIINRTTAYLSAITEQTRDLAMYKGFYELCQF